ncbi:glycosyltransferase family 9 protein [Fundidesulfovibrio agrisoli]|uniref:glycosyltransferase family 9 protein n=1 Tax=Fundidesulfovibrio agrisoli TaxID=2922717 RepID=UPI001FAC1E17
MIGSPHSMCQTGGQSGCQTGGQTSGEASAQAPAPAPALVLQMQRMGDIVLSFPLFLWLKRAQPARPVWVVAEEQFYQGLKAVSPPVVYAPWTAVDHLPASEYSLLVNLSHRPEAAILAGGLRAATRLGPYRDQEDHLRVGGRWQLYRAALTGNNRHNRFHWVELNALDCVDPRQIASTVFDTPRTPAPGKDRVGLFLGASQEEKRPPAAFWAALAHALQRRGLAVALLGGPAEQALAAEVRALHGGTLADFSGQLSLEQFMAAGQTMSLMITPDTGPMHVAAWSGLLTLNLSMGPVNPWETGPFSPGHYVLRAGISCQGCWQCRFAEPRCRERFDPEQVAYLAWKLARGGRPMAPPGMRLYRTGRGAAGYYQLEAVGRARPRAGDGLGEFWRGVFGAHFGLWGQDVPRRDWLALAGAHPKLARSFARGAARLYGRVEALLAAGGPLPPAFLESWPPMLRPAAGYVQMALENADYSQEARAECQGLLGAVLASVSPASV